MLDHLYVNLWTRLAVNEAILILKLSDCIRKPDNLNFDII